MRLCKSVFGMIPAGLLMLATALPAAVELRGRILPLAGEGSAVNIKVTIKSFSTPEEIERIKSLIIARDEMALRKAFKDADKATLQYIGSTGTNMKFGLAVELPADKGSRILLVNCQKGLSNQLGLGWEFIVAEFSVLPGAEGKGRIHDAASIKFPSPGVFDLDRFFSEPLQIVNLRRTK
jgi:hypothetical protein